MSAMGFSSSNRSTNLAFVVAAALAVATAATCGDAGSAAGDAERDASPDARVTTGDAVTTAPATAGSAAHGSDLIRDVRVNASATTVRISFTSVPATVATVVIGTAQPVSMAVPAILAEDGGVPNVYIMDPEAQVAGYLVRSTNAQYVLDTAEQEPAEDSTNGSPALRPGTMYHFIISAPPRGAPPVDDDDEGPIGGQYIGTFTTPR
jgi:hypothetical protein